MNARSTSAGMRTAPSVEPSTSARRHHRQRAILMGMVLERSRWRQAVHERDGYACVHCGARGCDRRQEDAARGVALDAHHLLERKLFGPDDPVPGGYDTDNGVSLCAVGVDGRPSCHELAERTIIGVAELRALAGITRVVLPAFADPSAHYDKWGNRLRDDGLREPGPLFTDTGCRRALAAGGVLGLFVHVFE